MKNSKTINMSSSEQVNETKVALVTCGNSSISEATALEYAKLGYQVAFIERNADKLKNINNQLIATMRGLNQSPEKRFFALQVDFERSTEVDHVIDKVIEKFGRLDILVNNAGYSGDSTKTPAASEFFEDFQRVLQLNLMVATRFAQLASPHLIKTKGVIVNVSSDCVAAPTISNRVSKAGLSMLTKTLANAHEKTGVRVVGVAACPNVNHLKSNMDKNHKIQWVEVAKVIVFVSSDKSSYIHGSTLDINVSACVANPASLSSTLSKKN